MRAEELRAVLLVKAIEESDGAGTILTTAERAAASRTARRENPGADAPDLLLAVRAQRLLPRILERHPVAGSRPAPGSTAVPSISIILASS